MLKYKGTGKDWAWLGDEQSDRELKVLLLRPLKLRHSHDHERAICLKFIFCTQRREVANTNGARYTPLQRLSTLLAHGGS